MVSAVARMHYFSSSSARDYALRTTGLVLEWRCVGLALLVSPTTFTLRRNDQRIILIRHLSIG